MKPDNNIPHESAMAHCTGKAQYVADYLCGPGDLVGRVFYSPHPSARILNYDLSEALSIAGVADILEHSRIPGANQLNPLAGDEPCLAVGTVQCIGQAMFLIAAQSPEAAYAAARAIKVEYELFEPILTIDEAMAKGNRLAPARQISSGKPEEAMLTATHRIKGNLFTGGQEHWYLETQSAVCVPGEQDSMTIYASSQNPTETQLVVAGVLGWEAHQVVCQVKRMGGGFGGKETQANHVAAWAALLANATAKPVKLVLFRDDDQRLTGKRHPFQSTYEIGFDNQGMIQAYIADMNSDAGMATDLSMAILERALFHADNAYFIPNIRLTATMWKTNMPSNTAFRGFGGPQGMAVIENAIDAVARFLGKDAAEIRYRNFYGGGQRQFTPYGQAVHNNRLYPLWDKLQAMSNYTTRRTEINAFNSANAFIKRGMALCPVKFGISFTTAFLNQAGALVHLYKDGSVMVNHGGTEMGQGLHTKIRQIAAAALGLPTHKVRLSDTDTSRVPNTSPTAASSGTDLNGMAVKNAIDTLKARLTPLALSMLEVKEDAGVEPSLVFQDGHVFVAGSPDRYVTFSELVKQAHRAQLSLSATGFYCTPGLGFDKEEGRGNPFHYYAFGMAVAEVETDMLTGRSRLLRVDIVHDAGDSINPAIDKGQVIGGFVQGLGWCTSETLRYSSEGQLLNCSPDTYKIPGIGDIPDDFRVQLLSGAPNESVIHNSKAVGEPPFMLAFAAWLAIKDAISAVGRHRHEPAFGLPANCELVVREADRLKHLT
ncbi:MAG: xanthine dehydrogenase molybdopterin binding subunit [Bacteroidales bacterium]|nr:xanthine dehydrogenase molybdopterin binding subunit [Bacteroidales bacterium]